MYQAQYKEAEIMCKTNGCAKRNVAMIEYHLHRKEMCVVYSRIGKMCRIEEICGRREIVT